MTVKYILHFTFYCHVIGQFHHKAHSRPSLPLSAPARRVAQMRRQLGRSPTSVRRSPEYQLSPFDNYLFIATLLVNFITTFYYLTMANAIIQYIKTLGLGATLQCVEKMDAINESARWISIDVVPASWVVVQSDVQLHSFT